MMFAKLILTRQMLRYKYPFNAWTPMMSDFVIDHLSTHLLTNHDSDWMSEFIDMDGDFAINYFLPTDSPETYIIVGTSNYQIMEIGKAVPQGLVDEITTVLADGLRIYVGWEGTSNPAKWA